MEIQDIKQQLTPAQVPDHYGLNPDKHLRLNCPFHPDDTQRETFITKTIRDDKIEADFFKTINEYFE